MGSDSIKYAKSTYLFAHTLHLMFAGTCLDNNIQNPLPGMSRAVSKSRAACGAESAATGP